MEIKNINNDRIKNINFIVRVEYPRTVPTINSLYLSTRTGRRYKNPKAKELQERVKYELNLNIPKNMETENKIIKLTIIYCFKKKFESKDISNLIKSIEDGCKEVLQIDDSKNFIVKSAKIYNDINIDEYISINIKIFDRERIKWKLSEKI